MDTLDEGEILTLGRTEWMVQGFITLFRTAHNTYELFIYRISHVMFLDYSWLWLTESAESKIADKGGLLYTYIYVYMHIARMYKHVYIHACMHICV